MKPLLQSLLARFRQNDGAAAVEMAFTCTFLLCMLFGIFEMSIAMYAYHVTSDAAREASRYAMVRGNTSCTNTPSLSNCGVTSDQIQTWIRSLNYPGITAAKLAVTTTWCAASTTTPTSWSSCSGSTAAAPGNLVKVAVTYPLTFAIPFAGNYSLNLNSTSEMVVSQ